MPGPTDFSRAIRGKARSHDRAIAELALRQHAVVAYWQLIALGLSPDAIQRRVDHGRLHRLHRGVYAVGHLRLPAKAHAIAAAFTYGPGTLVSHRSAAWLWDLLDDSRALIDVVGEAKRRSRPGIRYHCLRLLHPDDRAEIDGIPVTSVAHTLFDLAEVVPQRQLVYAIEQAEQLRVFDLTAVLGCIDRNRRRAGAKRLRQAVAATDLEAQHAHKGLERLFLAFCRDYDVQKPAMNAVVEGFTVDALWAKQRLVVELDSWKHHKKRRAFEEDRRRDAALALAGYQVLRVTYNWLVDEPAGLKRTLDQLLSERPSLAATA
jgi:very-short-patch-repair endonuclease